MKILITGCRGQLGTELQHQLSAEGCAIGPLPERLRKATVIPVDVDELDITDREATINYIRRHQPDTVINCAAFTNVDGCETARDAAFKVNAIGPRNLALACEKVNARLIHISTDYVFPGTANGGVALDECAVPAPISAYGQTKLLGEQYVERFCRRHFIVRTAWLYSSYGKNFVKTMIRLGRTHDKITVVNDSWATRRTPLTWPTTFSSWLSATITASTTAPATAFVAGTTLPVPSCRAQGLAARSSL